MKKLFFLLPLIALFICAPPANNLAPVRAKVLGAEPGQDSLPDLVANVKPAVVFITTFDKRGKIDGYATGFFIAPATIVTNRHVTEDSAAARITTHGGTIFYVDTVDEFEKHDLALMYVKTPSPHILTLAKEPPRIGEKIFVVGNPERLGWTVSEGIVAAYRAGGELMQISADVSPGSSGSPVLNMQGRVVGIISTTLETGQRLNFAVPASVIGPAMHGAQDKPATDTSKAHTFIATVAPGKMVDGWVDAGLHVRQGQYLKITAIGQMKIGGREVPPAGLVRLGDTEKLMRSVPTGALIGVIGADNDEFFAVGDGREMYAPRSGRLFLGVNVGDVRRLSGAFSVLIKTERR